jgi:hypothetical protein
LQKFIRHYAKLGEQLKWVCAVIWWRFPVGGESHPAIAFSRKQLEQLWR